MATLDAYRTSENKAKFTAGGLISQASYKFWIYNSGWWEKKTFQYTGSPYTNTVSVDDNNQRSTCLTYANQDPNTSSTVILVRDTLEPYTPPPPTNYTITIHISNVNCTIKYTNGSGNSCTKSYSFNEEGGSTTDTLTMREKTSIIFQNFSLPSRTTHQYINPYHLSLNGSDKTSNTSFVEYATGNYTFSLFPSIRYYTVKFSTQRGTAPSERSVSYNTNITLPDIADTYDAVLIQRKTLSPSRTADDIAKNVRVGGSGTADIYMKRWYSLSSWKDGSTYYSPNRPYNVKANKTLTAVWTDGQTDSPWHSNQWDSCYAYGIVQRINNTLNVYGREEAVQHTYIQDEYEDDGWYYYSNGVKTTLTGTSPIVTNTNIYPYLSHTRHAYSTLSAPELVREGYTLLGYDTSFSRTTVVYRPGEIIRFTAEGQSMTIYPIWQLNIYTVTYKDGNTVIGTQEYSIESDRYRVPSGYPTQSAKEAHPGYSGRGWFYNGAQIGTGSTITIYKNHTVDYQWNANLIKVNFNYNGGTVDSGLNFKYVYMDNVYGSLPNVRMAYRVFRGWWRQLSSESSPTQITSSTTMNIPYEHTIYATWSHYRVNYSGVSDSGKNISTVIEITDPSNASFQVKDLEDLGSEWERSNYTLQYWSSSDGRKLLPGGTASINQDLTLTAYYKRTQMRMPTVIYNPVNPYSATETSLTFNFKIANSLKSGKWSYRLLTAAGIPISGTTGPIRAYNEVEPSGGGYFTITYTGLTPDTKYIFEVANFANSFSDSDIASTLEKYFRTYQNSWTWNGKDTTGQDFSNIKLNNASDSWISYLNYIRGLGIDISSITAVDPNTKIFTSKIMNDTVFGAWKQNSFCGKDYRTEFRTGEAVQALYFQKLAQLANEKRTSRPIKVDS